MNIDQSLPAARSEAEGRLQLDRRQSEPLKTHLLLYLLYLITIVVCICFIWNYLSLSPCNYIVPILWSFSSPLWSSPIASDERVTAMWNIFASGCNAVSLEPARSWSETNWVWELASAAILLSSTSIQIKLHLCKITLETASHIPCNQLVCRIFANALILA